MSPFRGPQQAHLLCGAPPLLSPHPHLLLSHWMRRDHWNQIWPEEEGGGSPATTKAATRSMPPLEGGGTTVVRSGQRRRKVALLPLPPDLACHHWRGKGPPPSDLVGGGGRWLPCHRIRVTTANGTISMPPCPTGTRSTGEGVMAWTPTC